MSERRYEIQPVGIDYGCDTCNAGTMAYTGIMLPTSPPKYKHACDRCGAEANFAEIYPAVRWEHAK